MSLRSVAILLVVLGYSNATAQLADQLRITEVMWDSSHPGQNESDEGGHANGDWWELLNTSEVPVDMTGFMWDDDDRLEGFDFTIFPSFTIQPSEAVLVVREEASSVEFEDGFRAVWNLPANMRILSETFFEDTDSGDTFSGLSGGGDEVNLYDATGELIQRVVLGAAEMGRSLEWGFEEKQFHELGFAEAGEFGAFEGHLGWQRRGFVQPQLRAAGIRCCFAGCRHRI